MAEMIIDLSDAEVRALITRLEDASVRLNSLIKSNDNIICEQLTQNWAGQGASSYIRNYRNLSEGTISRFAQFIKNYSIAINEAKFGLDFTDETTAASFNAISSL